MGIPKFYRWLAKRYPFIEHAIESEDDVPPIDNLYFDLNGLVHNITHGNGTDRIVLTSHLLNTGRIDEIWRILFKAFDDIVHLINPRKVIFIALDSVPPVAKMVQQRSRRAKDEKSIEGISYLTKRQHEVIFDISAISPGTSFMNELNKKFDFFLQNKINEDPLYRRVRVIFSDSNVPGEGEQKITEYIRNYRGSPEYNPNTRHCIYGLDADLIMLALLTHEPHIFLLKDIVEQKFTSGKEIFSIPRTNALKEQDYLLVYISILREYFEFEFSYLKEQLKFDFDLERIIDDFVLFCFFVGNDFLPTLNTVDINYGSLDEIIRIYKNLLPKLNGYITDNGQIVWENASRIFEELGKSEMEVIKDRFKVIEEKRTKKETTKKETTKEDNLLDELKESIKKDLEGALNEEVNYADPQLKASQNFYKELCSSENYSKAKQLYYSKKLNIDITTEEGQEALKGITSKYIQGLQWVLYYYYAGVKHWGWFYCYHYAPLISDINCSKDYDFNKSLLELQEPNKPLEPFEQLLIILPKYSINLLPIQYHKLYDKDSPIIDLYPSNFEVDYNGRELPWEAVKLIPCINVCRILNAKNEYFASLGEVKFTEEEKERNTLHKPYEYLYVKDKSVGLVKSLIKNALDIVDNHCVKSEFVYESVKSSFTAVLAEGVEIPCFDFPSLKHINVEAAEVHPVKDKGVTFDAITLVIKDCSVNEKDLKSLIGETVYIDYPSQKEAIVTSIATWSYNLYQNHNSKSLEPIRINANNNELIEEAIQDLQSQGFRTSTKRNIKFLCYCIPMTGITKNSKTFYSKNYAYEESVYQSPIIMLKRDERHYLNCDHWLKNQKLQYPLYESCIILQGPLLGTIFNNKRRGEVEVKVELEKKEINQIAIKEENKKSFMIISEVAKILNVTKPTVSKLLSNVRVKLINENVKRIFNISLSLINYVQKLHVPYHFKYDSVKNEWAISDDIIKYLEEYKRRYPVIFKLVDNDEVLISSTLFPGSADPDIDIENLFEWILSLPISRLPYVPMGLTIIDAEVYVMMHEKLKYQVKKVDHVVKKELHEVFVGRRPFWIEPSKGKFKPGDRVISLKSLGVNYVPFGSIGTVIAANSKRAIVEFDKEILTGTNLYNEKGQSKDMAVNTNTLVKVFKNAKESYEERGMYKRGKEQRNYEGQYNYGKEYYWEENWRYYPQNYPDYSRHPASHPRNKQRHYEAKQIVEDTVKEEQSVKVEVEEIKSESVIENKSAHNDIKDNTKEETKFIKQESTTTSKTEGETEVNKRDEYQTYHKKRGGYRQQYYYRKK